MKRIFEDRKDVLMAAIGNATLRSVSISQDAHGEWQVGWASIGSVKTRIAGNFANLIEGAVDVASMLNRQQVKFIETEDCDPEIASDARFDECVKTLTEWFMAREYRKIEAWIIDGDIDRNEYEKACRESWDKVVTEELKPAKKVMASYAKIRDDDGELRGYKLGDYYLMKIYDQCGYSWVINRDGRRHYFSDDYADALARHEIESVGSCKEGKARLRELAGIR